MLNKTDTNISTQFIIKSRTRNDQISYLERLSVTELMTSNLELVSFQTLARHTRDTVTNSKKTGIIWSNNAVVIPNP